MRSRQGKSSSRSRAWLEGEGFEEGSCRIEGGATLKGLSLPGYDTWNSLNSLKVSNKGNITITFGFY